MFLIQLGFPIPASFLFGCLLGPCYLWLCVLFLLLPAQVAFISNSVGGGGNGVFQGHLHRWGKGSAWKVHKTGLEQTAFPKFQNLTIFVGGNFLFSILGTTWKDLIFLGKVTQLGKRTP